MAAAAAAAAAAVAGDEVLPTGRPGSLLGEGACCFAAAPLPADETMDRPRGAPGTPRPLGTGRPRVSGGMPRGTLEAAETPRLPRAPVMRPYPLLMVAAPLADPTPLFVTGLVLTENDPREVVTVATRGSCCGATGLVFKVEGMPL